MSNGPREGCAGQSLVEMVVGLLAAVLVVLGILQIGLLSMKHTQTLMNARADADEMAMQEDFMQLDPGASYAWQVSLGPDQRSYSQDDQILLGSPRGIIENVVDHADPDLLRSWVSTNRFRDLERPQTFMDALELTRGQSISERVDLYPLIRNLVASDDYIRVRRLVWMPWLRGL